MTKRGLAFLPAFALAAPDAGAVAFNDVFPGARAMGMGTASAIADDAFGLFYNPAGTVGRMLSPKRPLSFATGVYLRPYEPINTATNKGRRF